MRSARRPRYGRGGSCRTRPYPGAHPSEQRGSQGGLALAGWPTPRDLGFRTRGGGSVSCGAGRGGRLRGAATLASGLESVLGSGRRPGRLRARRGDPDCGHRRRRSAAGRGRHGGGEGPRVLARRADYRLLFHQERPPGHLAGSGGRLDSSTPADGCRHGPRRSAVCARLVTGRTRDRLRLERLGLLARRRLDRRCRERRPPADHSDAHGDVLARVVAGRRPPRRVRDRQGRILVRGPRLHLRDRESGGTRGRGGPPLGADRGHAGLRDGLGHAARPIVGGGRAVHLLPLPRTRHGERVGCTRPGRRCHAGHAPGRDDLGAQPHCRRGVSRLRPLDSDARRGSVHGRTGRRHPPARDLVLPRLAVRRGAAGGVSRQF